MEIGKSLWGYSCHVQIKMVSNAEFMKQTYRVRVEMEENATFQIFLMNFIR